MSDTTGQDQQQNMRRVAMTSLAGTSIEWYDFFLYGTAAAVIFPKAFFPQDLPTMVLLIISFSTLAVGFLARPLGWHRTRLLVDMQYPCRSCLLTKG